MMTAADIEALLAESPRAFNEYRAAHADEPIDLFEANLAWRNLEGVNFAGADLRRCWLEGCALAGARFDGARMDHANLRSTKLRGATFRGATLRWATFQQEWRRNSEAQGCARADRSSGRTRAGDVAWGALSPTGWSGADQPAPLLLARWAGMVKRGLEGRSPAVRNPRRPKD